MSLYFYMQQTKHELSSKSCERRFWIIHCLSRNLSFLVHRLLSFIRQVFLKNFLIYDAKLLMRNFLKNNFSYGKLSQIWCVPYGLNNYSSIWEGKSFANFSIYFWRFMTSFFETLSPQFWELIWFLCIKMNSMRKLIIL